MEVEGVTGWVALAGTEVQIRKKLLYGKGRGVKAIAIGSISSIQFRAPGLLTNGFIQFAFSGGKETHGGTFDAVNDENSVVFNKAQLSAFEALRDEIKRRQAELASAAPSTAASSAADEIERFAGLRDRGLITEEEFQAKKAQLLGL